MKKTLILISLIFAGYCSAQVAIGKSTVDGNGLLDFGTENKGIILPIADTSDASVIYTNGTILMDKNDFVVKAYFNNSWNPLTDPGQVTALTDANNNPITTEAKLNSSEELGNGVVIGDVDVNGNPLSGADGVLILESTDKALILPKVADPHINIKSPVAGTMCYDLTSDSLAIFDGKVWNYWK